MTRDDEFMDYIDGLRLGLQAAKERIAKLEQTVEAYGEILDGDRGLRNRVYALEHDTPQARRLQRELDETLADNAAAGYGPDDEYGPE